jgi:hypothetical protein
MMDPRDVFACLTYLSKGDLSRIGDELVNGEKIPGWYVRAYQNEGYTDIHKYTRISDAFAEQIALAIDLRASAVPAGNTSRPLRDRVCAINLERLREKKERYEALLAEIQRLERERIRLKDEIDSGGTR